MLCAKTLQWHDECGQIARLRGTSQGFPPSLQFCKTFLMSTNQPTKNCSVLSASSVFFYVVLYLCWCTRVRSQHRANCSSKTPSPSPSRTAASCPGPRKDGSSCLSSWSYSVSQSTGRKVSHSLDTSSRTASRWAPAEPQWPHVSHMGSFSKKESPKLRKDNLLQGSTKHNRFTFIFAHIVRQRPFTGSHV